VIAAHDFVDFRHAFHLFLDQRLMLEGSANLLYPFIKNCKGRRERNNKMSSKIRVAGRGSAESHADFLPKILRG
jgi:hypothetical protein